MIVPLLPLTVTSTFLSQPPRNQPHTSLANLTELMNCVKTSKVLPNTLLFVSLPTSSYSSPVPSKGDAEDKLRGGPCVQSDMLASAQEPH